MANEANQNAPFDKNRNECEFYTDYLERAVKAHDAGSKSEALFLYLIAYDKAMFGNDESIKLPPSHPAVDGLRCAWMLAYDLGERNLAEYIYERLIGYLNDDEVRHCTMQLQNLALHKLQEIGISASDLEEMADMISADVFGGAGMGVDVKLAGPSPVDWKGQSQEAAQPAMLEEPQEVADYSAAAQAALDAEENSPTKDQHAISRVEDALISKLEAFASIAETAREEVVASLDELGHEGASLDTDVAEAAQTNGLEGGDSEPEQLLDAPLQEPEVRVSEDSSGETANDDTSKPTPVLPELPSSLMNQLETAAPSPDAINDFMNRVARNAEALREAAAKNGFKIPPMSHAAKAAAPGDAGASSEALDPVAGYLRYKDLVGYDDAIVKMRSMGFGLGSDQGFQNFLTNLNELHGIDRLPAFGTMLFRSFAREDATRLMLATAAELDVPTIRMYMDENAQGIPILCVIASPEFRANNLSFATMVQAGVLILEDVDLWGIPFEGYDHADSGNIAVQMSHGVRRAVAVIRSAVENPHVHVFASASSSEVLDGFMTDLMQPINVMDIPRPTPDERASIWDFLASKHKSLAPIDRRKLVVLSSNMSRYDIFCAAREAVEEAYKESLVKRTFVDVTPENIFEKVAAYQPLESQEYRDLEDEVISSFRQNLLDIEAHLGEEPK